MREKKKRERTRAPRRLAAPLADAFPSPSAGLWLLASPARSPTRSPTRALEAAASCGVGPSADSRIGYSPATFYAAASIVGRANGGARRQVWDASLEREREYGRIRQSPSRRVGPERDEHGRRGDDRTRIVGYYGCTART